MNHPTLVSPGVDGRLSLFVARRVGILSALKVLGWMRLHAEDVAAQVGTTPGDVWSWAQARIDELVEPAPVLRRHDRTAPRWLGHISGVHSS